MHALPRRLVAVVAALLLTVLATVVTGFRGGVPDRMGVRRGMRNALGMGLRTMSSIAWFPPVALLLFQLSFAHRERHPGPGRRPDAAPTGWGAPG